MSSTSSMHQPHFDNALVTAISELAPATSLTNTLLSTLAKAHNVSLLTVQRACCVAGRMPVVYARNTATLTANEQLLLLSARVFVLGLGGLGGYVVEFLARMGVGTIIGADGDTFEESNCNRQLLATTATLHQSKAEAAFQRLELINPATQFISVPQAMDEVAMRSVAHDTDVFVDALGGLAFRRAAQSAACHAGIPLVTAGIAGLTGWVSVVMPHEQGPTDWMDADNTTSGVEENLGNLAPTAALAASLQAAEVLRLLTGRPTEPGLRLFDLADMHFEIVRF